MPDFDEMLFTAHHMARFSEKPEPAAYWMGVEEGLRAGRYGCPCAPFCPWGV